MNNQKFQLTSDFKPAGDQPTAITELVQGVKDKERDQVLLGVTGSGKTFTMAHVIQETQKPALILAHNKTLAAQLYGEMKEFFPNNSVEYFVSYYDYYQPEAYIARTDTFIEKDSAINEQIDLLRHSATRALIERRDVIVVASISCIYGLGSPELYMAMTLRLEKGGKYNVTEVARRLVELQYKRNDTDFSRGSFRMRGDNIDVFPSHYEDRAWRLSFFGEELEDVYEFDSLTGEKMLNLDAVTIFAHTHYITPKPTISQMIDHVKVELKDRLSEFESQGKLLEAQRLSQRTQFDLEMLVETGTCKGIENYSRYLSGRHTGEPPPTLFEYLPRDSLLFIDESHATVPQIGAMYNGDRARKTVLVEHGFRLPSALDNRPLKFEEWERMRPQTIYVSATPGPYEMEKTGGQFSQQVIRPTGLIDPVCIIKPVETQVDDLLAEIKEAIAKGGRVLVTTLTKKMAENLTDYIASNGTKVSYMHSDVETLDRIEIIQDLRRGVIDVLVGINLLREGLDIPECMLVAILDADKEGFLRSATSLIQTIGRAARNVDSKVVLYADVMTKSLTKALAETDRRRTIQQEYNREHNITPETIKKSISKALDSVYEKDHVTVDIEDDVSKLRGKDLRKYIAEIEKKMLRAAGNLDFEEAAKFRDELHKMKERELEFGGA